MTTDNGDFILESILRDISDGVIAIGFDGVIEFVNYAACKILKREAFELEGKRFASCFFEYEENDGFNQAVMDAVYDKENTHESFVEFFTGEKIKQLHMTTSFLIAGEERIGVIASFRDITELSELRDALKAMEKIKALNSQLEIRNKLLQETFGRFLSDDIVKEILDTPGGLSMGGKKRDVTVLMSDLRGFTAMSETMPPESLITMLNHYFHEMLKSIDKYRGTLIEFLGDGILVVFGAPKPMEAHAANAVACALSMSASMDEINRWNKERGYPELEMGIGINSGDTIVGIIGSMKRSKYGVMGSQVNLCGRIESYTTGGQVLISPNTRVAIKQELTVAEEMEVFPKGADHPITISRVTAIGEPYNVSYERRMEAPVELARPSKVSFLVLSGKHVGNVRFDGRITAISSQSAILETDCELSEFENIQIEIGGKLTAKVTEKVTEKAAEKLPGKVNEKIFEKLSDKGTAKVNEKVGENYLICFTAKPASFDEWYNSVVG